MIYIHGILIVIFSIYTGWMLALIFGWLIRNNYKITSSSRHNSLSVLIPYRNEQENIPLLLKSLSDLDYSTDRVEFVFINDHSVDNSADALMLGLVNFPFSHKSISNCSTASMRKPYSVGLQDKMYLTISKEGSESLAAWTHSERHFHSSA